MARVATRLFSNLFNATGHPGLALVDAVVTLAVLATGMFAALRLFAEQWGILAVCYAWLALKTSDEQRYKALCHTLREDGRFIEAGENDNLIVQKLDANPRAFGVFGFSFLDQNSEKVQASAVGGVRATFESIADGTYPISRPLYVYVKKAHVHVIPGIAEFLAEFTSPRAWGPEGYLADKGMIPMPDEERAQVKNAALTL